MIVGICSKSTIYKVFVLALFQQVRKTSTAGVGTAGPGPGPAPGTGKTSPPASPGGPAAAKAKKMRKDSAASGAGQLLFVTTVKDSFPILRFLFQLVLI